jgi:general secretion pathway protein E
MQELESSSKIHYLTKEEFPQVPLITDDLSARFIRRHQVVPVSYDHKHNTLLVIMKDPYDTECIDAMRVATGSSIKVFGANATEIEEYISNFYSKEAANLNKIVGDIVVGSQGASDDEEEDVGYLKDLAAEAPIIKLVNLIISRAIESRASDIHIEPFEDELKVRYRIDGVLHDVETTPSKLQAAIVSRIKIMSKLNIAERRLPQDGQIKLRVGDREIDFRVSTLPVIYGESIVLRILDKQGVPVDLETFGFAENLLKSFKDLINLPHGIILVTGPTGSGKTTTLYGALSRINSPEKKIITVEDPVEYQLKGVNQIHIKPKIGLNFAAALRHIVRQDPDVIMIGEIRDLETAEIAIQSSLTGHLVFSTLHTNDAPSSISRLIDMGVENFLLASTLRGILAQRLVRVICPQCKDIDYDSAPILLNEQSESFRQYKGKGCEKCSETGFYGRTGIFEFLPMKDNIRRLIVSNADSSVIMKQARENGMITLLEDGIRKVKEGITSMGEVLRVTQEL